MTTIIPAALSPRQLAEEVRRLAATPRQWMSRVRLSADGRWYERIHVDGSYEIWLISWLPGQATGFHDHGGSAGAFCVVWGALEEHRPGGSGRRPATTTARVTAGRVRSFAPEFVHDVRNSSEAVAVSVHAYSPPLAQMTRYDLTAQGQLAVLDTEAAAQW
jgi:predicted metal-dependent enzyme (double-stranded beta helix superfamily)